MATGTMLSAALAYAARGWHVFPVHTPIDYDRCSCHHDDCENIGKHPRTQHGLSDATNDEGTITRWWTQWPKANIGVACAPSGLVVIDIDPRHGGDESYRDLVTKYGPELTQTLTGLTGGGGQHLVFEAPHGVRIGDVANKPGYAGPLGPGVDVRAQGYFVAPPSMHQSGNRYAWEEEGEQPARLPLPLYELLTARPEQSMDDERVSAADILKGVDAGGRDWELFRLASKLRYADVPYDWARQLVLEAAANCRPPFPAIEAIKKVDSAWRYEAGKQGIADPEDAVSPQERANSALIDWPTFWASDQRTAEWLCEPLIPAGRQVAIFSSAKSGKSLLTLDIAARLATGRKCLYQPAGDPIRVAYFDFEMTDLDLRERLENMGYGPETDFSHLFYYLLPSLPPLDTPKGGEALLEIVRHHDAEVVIIDTTARVISGKENDSDSYRAFYMYTGLYLKAEGRTVVRLDHAGKAEDLGQRGSSAKNDDVDLVWHLTVEEGETIKLHATHRRQGWVPEEIYLTRNDDPLRHDPVAKVWPAGTMELVAILDEIGAPMVGRRAVSKLLKDAGHKVRTQVVAAAMQYRVGVSGTTAGTTGNHGSTVLGTTAGTTPAVDSGTTREPREPLSNGLRQEGGLLRSKSPRQPGSQTHEPYWWEKEDHI